MKLPPVAPFPPATLRGGVTLGEWEACIDAWTALVAMHLRLSAQDFASHSIKDDSLVAFLTSYVQEVPNLSGDETYVGGLKSRSLRRECFLLAYRFLSDDRIPSSLLDWAFLADLCSTYVKSTSLRGLFGGLWSRHATSIEPSLQNLRHSLIRDLENASGGKTEYLASTLFRIGPLLYVSQDVSRFFMVGSDLLDALFAGYMNAPPPLQRRIVTTTYLGLISLLGAVPNISLLLDHLYGLKSLADTREKGGKRAETLVSDLVTNTPLLRKLRDKVYGTDAVRAKSLVSLLETFRNPKEKRHIFRKTNKGKGRATIGDSGQELFGGKARVHRMSLVTQIQELFPNLGSDFIMKLLDEYGSNTELVTSHLLEGSLPPHLHNADWTEELSGPGGAADGNPDPLLNPQPIPGVFDNDVFDNLAIDASRLHIGRKNKTQTADGLLSDRSNAPNKATILSALAGFDSDDDERDDTYDVEDIGGTVDSASPAGDPSTDQQNEKEEALFSAYKHDPGVFLRDSATRLSKARQTLKAETGMTDEAIEGWSIMLGRDPRRLKKLEAKYTAFIGAQRELSSTAYRGGLDDSGTEEAGGGRGYRGKRGRGGRGRGGGVTGSASERGTQISRRGKEANKGSRANHSRRDRRAHKMARGGFAG
ncbi:MAG: hypothetical protein M1840_001148 [Geoglossum simile]|nr:MAG: hypothetical protein M1840_001148 [Geoglossum simile]